MKTVSVVIPVYYNQDSLPPLFQELQVVEQKLLKMDLSLELIFVDDGSGDSSFLQMVRIRESRPETKLIKLTRNFGAVHASKTGIKFVTGDCFLVLAADLQDPPDLICEMVQRWLEGSKYVLCARTNRDDPAVSSLFANIYYKLLRWFVVPDYPPGGYDMALMDKAFLPYMQTSAKNINPPLFAYWLGFKPTTIGYQRRKRIHGHSRWTFSKRMKFFLDSLLGFSILPIRAISGLGFLISTISFAYGSLIVVNAMFGRTDVPGYASLAALMMFLCGLIIVMLGIIGEYIWRIFDELNNRPEAVIDEVHGA